MAVPVAAPAVLVTLPTAVLPDAVVLLATRPSLFAMPGTPDRALLGSVVMPTLHL